MKFSIYLNRRVFVMWGVAPSSEINLPLNVQCESLVEPVLKVTFVSNHLYENRVQTTTDFPHIFYAFFC